MMQSSISDFLRVLGGRKESSQEARCFCPLCRNPKEPTLKITIEPDITKYYCFKCGDDITIKRLLTITLLDLGLLLNYAKQGKKNEYISKEQRKRIEKEKIQRQRERERKKKEKLKKFNELLQAVTKNVSQFDIILSNYMEGRGIELREGLETADIREIERYPKKQKDKNGYSRYYPAICSFIRKQGKIIGIHTIFLEKIKGRYVKADIPVPKRIEGSKKGGYIEMQYDLDGFEGIDLKNLDFTLWICEGVETAIALQDFLSFKRQQALVLCAVDAGNLKNLDLSRFNPSLVVIAADNDKSKTGQKKALQAKETYEKQGYKTIIKIPSQVGFDWLDEIAKETI